MTDPPRDPLAEFVRTHITDDARTADEAIDPLGGRWRASGGGVEVVTDALTADVFQRTVCFGGEGAPTDQEALHIARHDPERTIRGARARQRIVDFCDQAIHERDEALMGRDDVAPEEEHQRIGAGAFAETILQLLAERYADAGDHDPTWQPKPE